MLIQITFTTTYIEHWFIDCATFEFIIFTMFDLNVILSQPDVEINKIDRKLIN